MNRALVIEDGMELESPPTSGESQGAAVSPERRAAVEGACRTWINRLIDPSRRNNLLFFRELREGTLDLSRSPEEAIAALVSPSSSAVKLAELVKQDELVTEAAKLQEIRKRAVVNQEERGLDTLFLALGMARWPASDDGRHYAAPVLLMPIAVEQTGTDRRRLMLTRTGELQPNLVLLHYLETQKVQVDTEQLVSLVEGDDHEEDFDLEPAFTYLNNAVGTLIPQFSIDPHYIVGNFSFQKMAMVRDLRELLEQLVHHDMVAAMARDPSASAALRRPGSDAQLPDIDAVTPDEEFLVLDADSTQHRAIGQALIGRNGVISGPPGTGKSQTIANLICEFAARGKKVLFVAEKRAALEAVLKRLERKRLAHLCLDLHGAEVSRRQVLERVAVALEKVRDAQRVDPSAVHQRFVERRSRLNDHVQRLHVTRKPSDLSIFTMQGRLLRLSDRSCLVRWRRQALRELTPERRRQILDLLDEASGFPGLFTLRDPEPWTHAIVKDAAEAQRAYDLATTIARSVGPVTDRARIACREVGLTEGATIADVAERVSIIVGLNELAERFDLEIFVATPGALATALAPAHSLFSRLWATLANPGYRAALSQVRSLSTQPNRSPAELLADVTKAEELGTRWLRVAVPGSLPRVSNDDVIALQSAVSTLAGAVADLCHFFAGVNGLTQTIDAVRGWSEALAADAVAPVRVARIRQINAELRTLGAGELVDDICSADHPAGTWSTRFDFAWLTSCLDSAFAEEPALATFSGQSHQEVVEEFKRLDVERLELAIARVVRSHAERVIAVRNAHPEQDALMKREAAKKRRHLPLRQLVAGAPDVLTALHPCWMASPLSVSQLLPGDKQYFDAVIFDEASQVLPEDGVTSLLRGRQCVVAGDRRQLPPTTFFAAGTDEGDDDSDTTGFESLLDVITSIVDLPWNLDWHYRSRDESLIAYSNHHVYGNRLVTVPGAGGEQVVWHVLVPHVLDASSEETSSAEVKRVVELVLEHARARPHETLGVIAMGIAHARRVEAAVELAVQEHPELEAFFDAKQHERFFVKNLERVQGDERDAIILSIGYGKDASGTLPYRFGPLLTEGGERRLNVAITRARSRMTLVSSFSHLDMDPGRSKAKGVQLLRGFLEYAAKGGTGLTRSEGTEVPLNDFEQDVCDALRAKGMDILPQWGASKYRIDLVAQHPRRPGQFVLAIECDGASYHASAGARDRDRLRQQHLEALGWRFHRIWSTDWFLQRDKEIARTEDVFRRAVASADSSVTQAPARPATTPEVPADRPPPNTTDSGAGESTVIPRRASIDEYQPAELDQVVRRICAGANMTDDEIVDEAVTRLGFGRRGRRIDAAIRRSIERVRRSHDGRGNASGTPPLS